MIDSALLSTVLEQVASRCSDHEEVLLTHLRQSHPGTHFSICNDDDIPPRMSPVAANRFCHLYYVDSAEHCLRLTSDAEAATGLVVALRDSEDA